MENKIKYNEWKRNWRKNNPEKVKNHRLSFKERYPDYYKNYQRNLRIKCINYYSNNKNCCACCGEKRFEFLAIDHIHGDGSKHRKLVGKNMVRWIINNNFPNMFMILCHNCNQSMGIYGYCPHRLPPGVKEISDLINVK